MAIHLCICLFICISECLHTYLSVLLSVCITAKYCVFICVQQFITFHGETLRRPIWGLACVKLIAFLCSNFWQWNWWMALWKMWHGVASCCNLMLLWSPNELYFSKHAADFITLIDINTPSSVCFMWTCMYDILWWCISMCVTLCLCAWLHIMYVQTGGIEIVTLHTERSNLITCYSYTGKAM